MPPNTDIEVSVVLTLHRAETYVSDMVREIVDCMKSSSLSYEILAVETGSVDNTASVLNLLAKQHTELRVLPNTDKSAAIERGVRAARGEIWICLDSPIPTASLNWMLNSTLGDFHASFVESSCASFRALALRRPLGTTLRNYRGNLSQAYRAIRQLGRHDTYLRFATLRPEASDAMRKAAQKIGKGRGLGNRLRRLRTKIIGA